ASGPRGARALPPVEAAGEFGAHGVAVEIVEEGARLVVGPAVKAQRKAGVDIERLAAGLGVANDDGVDGILRRQLRIADAAGEVALAGAALGAEDVAARMARGE